MPVFITEPTIIVWADMAIRPTAAEELVEWLREYDPKCLDADEEGFDPMHRLYPHDLMDESNAILGQRPLTDNELLVEIAGRGCYRSYGKKAGRKDNAQYIANLMGAPGKVPHASVSYHAKMTFFIAGISRRVSHELIRNYVGADRSEEGCPSQESTRYTEHPGHFAVHPRDLQDPSDQLSFRRDMTDAYARYREYLSKQIDAHHAEHGKAPAGMARKRIYEAAAMRLPSAACTSFFWTTNPEALSKLFRERCDSAADLEFQRLACMWRDLCYSQWPNLFRESNEAYRAQWKKNDE
jgi:thymidylate synthase (FAD)